MHNFSEQCLDLARSLLSNNLHHINEDGSVTPAPDEKSRVDEPGHAALAIGEYFRASGDVELEGYDLFDLSAPVSLNKLSQMRLLRMVWRMPPWGSFRLVLPKNEI